MANRNPNISYYYAIIHKRIISYLCYIFRGSFSPESCLGVSQWDYSWPFLQGLKLITEPSVVYKMTVLYKLRILVSNRRFQYVEALVEQSGISTQTEIYKRV